VCNLYSVHTTQEAMRRAFEIARDSAGNVPPLSAIFPDQMAPVVRMIDGERELIQMRWGFPPPPKVGTQPVTNVRNVGSPFWRAWLKPQHRCLVPLTSFSEYKDTKPRKTPVWFALSQDRPLAASRGSGGHGQACAARRLSRPRESTCFTRSSHPSRTASSGQFIRKPCR
jgi:putative SOS response-associated peptidase YedK